MSDSLGSKMEKLFAYRNDHFEMGKEFDEKKIRIMLGMDPVANPEFLPETPDRRRLVRMDDREAKREMEEAKAKADAAILASKTAGLEAEQAQSRIAALEAQIAEMKRAAASGDDRVVVAESTPVAAPAPAQTASDVPDSTWTIPRMQTYLEEHNLPLPTPKKFFGMTKVAALDYTLDQIAKAAEAKE